MIKLTQKHRDELRAFLNTDTALAVIAYLRENPPKQPYGENIQPHHVQISYGISIGWNEWPKRLEQLAHGALSADEPSPQEGDEQFALRSSMRRSTVIPTANG